MSALPARDADRIERIQSPTEARVEVRVETAPVQRSVRKDFHIVTAKMLLARGEKARAVAAALNEFDRLSIEAELSEPETSAVCDVPLPAQLYRLRLVSAPAARLLRALLRIDRINARLLSAETRGAITRKERMQVVRPVLQAMGQLKTVALELPPRARGPATPRP